MLSWHATDCQFPDVSFWENINGVLDVPCCSSCGNIGVLEHNSSGDAIGTTREAPSHANLNLSWPSCLPFVEEPAENGAQFDTANSGLSIHGRDTADQTAVTAGSAATHSQGYPAPDTSGFSYDHLSGRKVRLIELLPGNYHDRLRCELTTYDLRHRKPDYEAVSYTWADENGDTSMKQKLYVGKHYNILAITANCANALRRLRYPRNGARRHLWIDAVCIDQHNIHERSHQVGMMRDIYTMAKRVLVYIGEDTDDPDPFTSVPWTDRTKGRNIEVHSNLAQRAYFTRMWVIQEVASAKTAWVLHGSRGFVWKDIDNATGIIHEKYELLASSHPWLELATQQKGWGMNDLLQLMISTTRCQATDPRDKAFALLGLFTGTSEVGLTPDYALSSAQVFSGLTAYFFRENTISWWRLFSMCRPFSSQGMPTWAIDWAVDWTELIRLQDIHSHNSEVYLELTANGKQDDEARDSASANNPDPANPNKARIIRPVQENGLVRFQRDGSLIVKAFSPYSPAECLIERPAANKPPGVFTGVDYMPSTPLSDREARLKANPWARKEDKVFVVDGLPNHLLILRPDASSTKYTYVGICDPPRLRFDNRLTVFLNTQAISIIAAWTTILTNVNWKCWLDPRFWAFVKKACEKRTTLYQKNTNSEADDDACESPEDVLKDIRAKWMHPSDEQTCDIPSRVILTTEPKLTQDSQGGLYDYTKDSPETSDQNPEFNLKTSEDSIDSVEKRYAIFASWISTRNRLPDYYEWKNSEREYLRKVLFPQSPTFHPPNKHITKLLLDFKSHNILEILLEHDLDTLWKGAEYLDKKEARLTSFLQNILRLPSNHMGSRLENLQSVFWKSPCLNRWWGSLKKSTNSEDDRLRRSTLLKLFDRTARYLFPLEEFFTNYSHKDSTSGFWAYPPFVAKADWKDVCIG